MAPLEEGRRESLSQRDGLRVDACVVATLRACR